MKGFLHRSSALLSMMSLLGLTACVTIDIRKNNPTTQNHAATFTESMVYLQAARAALSKHSDRMETIDAVTRLGVGVGIAGAGIAAATKDKPAKLMGKFLTGGAVSYMASRSIAPISVAQVYRAGMTNLECIRSAAIHADRDVAALRRELGDGTVITSKVTARIGALEQEIESIRSEGDDVQTDTLQEPIQTTLDATRDARNALRVMQRFLDDSRDNTLVGERVLVGVNGTLQIVNQNALARTPDVEAILQSGAAFSRFLQYGADWAADIQSAKDKLAAAAAGAQGAQDNLIARKERLLRGQVLLKVALNAIPDLSITGLSEMSECRTIVDALVPVTVTPNPIIVTAGGDTVQLTLTGRKTHVARDLPAHVVFDPGSYKLTASKDAKAGSYTVHFTDGQGIDSGDVALTVNPAAQTTTTTTTSDPPDNEETTGAQDPNPPLDGVAATPTKKKDESKDGQSDAAKNKG